LVDAKGNISKFAGSLPDRNLKIGHGLGFDRGRGLFAAGQFNVETAENLSLESKYSSSCKYFGAEATDR
jgi:hypothetical protein